MDQEVTEYKPVFSDRSNYERAKIIYLSNEKIGVREIAEMFGATIEEAQLVIYGRDGRGSAKTCWDRIRRELTPAALISVMADKQHIVEQVGVTTLNIILKSLTKLNERVHSDDGEPLTVDEMQKLSDVFTKMDKIMRLDRGEATDIHGHQMALTQQQQAKILRVLNSDKFADAIEADYAEIERIEGLEKEFQEDLESGETIEPESIFK